MMTTNKAREQTNLYSTVLVLSAWGFTMVIASFLFLYIGYWIDKIFETSPTFMIGLFFLAVFTSIFRFYQEAWRKKQKV
jgi:F0F1-type ATP synthase assembly protein I